MNRVFHSLMIVVTGVFALWLAAVAWTAAERHPIGLAILWMLMPLFALWLTSEPVTADRSAESLRRIRNLVVGGAVALSFLVFANYPSVRSLTDTRSLIAGTLVYVLEWGFCPGPFRYPLVLCPHVRKGN